MRDCGHTCIDLEHLDLDGAICCYLVDGAEPTIIDPGPATTLERLLEQLGAHGIGRDDLRNVLLTHIHLDHAGSTGHLLERFPKATVYLHEDGASHMVEPERLVASTRRTFGEMHDRLWGDVKPVSADRIRVWRADESKVWAGLRPVSTPGHIPSHLAYLDERDGTLFSGDSMGIALSGGPQYAPTPPPSVNLRDWARTMEEIGQIGPERFGATHFGFHDDVETRRIQLLERLDALERRVRVALEEGDEEDADRYDAEMRSELAPFMGEDRANRYFDMFSAATDWAGVAFYVQRNP